VKIKTINVLIDSEYGDTEIHAYFISDNLPATKINESVSEAYTKFRTAVEEIIKLLGLEDLSETEMAMAIENEFWDSHTGVTVEIQRSEV
jgi:hypothetical protein